MTLEWIGAILTVLAVVVIPSVAGVFKTHSRLQQAESDLRSLQTRVEQTERKHDALDGIGQRLVKIETLLDILIKKADHEK